jgi:hypothetical protein
MCFLTDHTTPISSKMLIADPARTWQIAGDAPWFPALGNVLRKAPELLDRLLNRYAKVATSLQSQNSFWICFHMYVVTQLSAAALDGELDVSLEEAVWCSYATAYWGLNEAKQMSGDGELSTLFQPQVPSEQDVAELVREIGDRLTALADDNAMLSALPTFVGDRSNNGMIHGFAYDSRYLMITGEAPPLGNRPPDVEQIVDGSVRMNRRDVLRVDYGITTPGWLTRARTAYEVAAEEKASFEAAAAKVNAAELWIAGIELADAVWGWQDLSKRPRETYIDIFDAAVLLNGTYEATALNGLTALATGDAAVARGAIQANAIAIGYWGTVLMAFQDPDGAPPVLVPVD